MFGDILILFLPIAGALLGYVNSANEFSTKQKNWFTLIIGALLSIVVIKGIVTPFAG